MTSRLSMDGKLPGDEDHNKLSRLASQNRHARQTSLAGPDGAKPHEGLRLNTSATSTRRIVCPDLVVFRFLEEDPAVTVIERRVVLPGYELHLVEQWACSRESPTLVIATYTGDDRQSIVAGVFSVPTDQDSNWSPRLRLYFRAIQQYHGRPKETEYGELMVTNLNSFPSALSVILVPDGDIRKHRELFIVNENLKRLGCAGRSAMTLADPSSATQTKFYQLYRVSDRVPLFEAVQELVKLCQVGLFMFDKLDQEYIDGLLCDKTETSIGNWWTEIGAEHYNFEPTDGILGPSTVAALIGMFIGARNRLSYLGTPVSKDVFDLEGLKRGIGHFQKQHKQLARTRRLDRPTLLQLHKSTAKAAAGEGWGVQKAVKSTITEVGGKRGEMVMGMVGGKEKAGIAEVETFDIDRFVALASGERAKWLWHGKPRRSIQEHGDKDGDLTNPFISSREEIQQQPGRRTKSAPLPDEEPDGGILGDGNPDALFSAMTSIESPEKEASRKKVFKTVAGSVTGKISDARSGLGRIKDAVGGGLRGHASRPSGTHRDDMSDINSTPSIAALAQQSTSLSSSVMTGRKFTWQTKPEEYLAGMRSKEDSLMSRRDIVETPVDIHGPSTRPSTEELSRKVAVEGNLDVIGTDVRKKNVGVTGPPSCTGSVVDDRDLTGTVLALERGHSAQFHLHRRHSLKSGQGLPNENRWPRAMSFSQAEEAVLRWDEVVSLSDDDDLADDDDNGHAAAEALAELAKALYANIGSVRHDVQPWVDAKAAAIDGLDARYARAHDEIQTLVHSRGDEFAQRKHEAELVAAGERRNVKDALDDLDALAARLEYEINALEGKVQDVDDAVELFERQVVDVERRADELRGQLERESFLHWIVRTLTGVGTGPHITRTE